MTALMINGLVNGIIVGGLYALLGLSLSLLYGVLRVVNFAHGELVIAGSYLAYVLFSAFGLSPLAALPLAAISFFIVGWARISS
jgi:branched-chain amino acid transport system permease protein